MCTKVIEADQRFGISHYNWVKISYMPFSPPSSRLILWKTAE